MFPRMDEDWRVRLTFADQQASQQHAERLEAMKVEQDLGERLGARVAVSRDGAELFLYANSEDDARAAEHIASADLDADHWASKVELSRWHEAAEDWEPADRPLPRTAEERAAERKRLMSREDQETAAEGYAEWEVRVELPTHHDARALAERLRDEGVSCVHRWRYILVGAEDEDAARQWETRLRGEAPGGAKLSVEGTFATVERQNPFAFFSAVSGGA